MTTVTRRRPRPISDPAAGEPSATPHEGRPSGRRLAAVPAELVILPMAAVGPDQLGVGEMLDLATQLGTDLDGMVALMSGGDDIARARYLVGLAWLLARRDDPTVTYADAQRWRIQVVEDPPDPTPAAPPDGARLG